MTTDAPAVTAKVDVPHAGVLLLLAFPDVAVQSAVITRTDLDGTTSVVRGGDRVDVTGGRGYAYDSEAPLDVPVTYRAFGIYSGSETYDPVDEVTATSTAVSVVVPNVGHDTSSLWVKPITNPSLTVQVAAGRLPDLEEPSRTQSLQIIGREDEIEVGDVRSLRRGTIVVQTFTVEQGRAFRAALRVGGVYLLQGPACFDLEMFWCSIGAAPEDTEAREAGDAFRAWSLAVTEKTRPSTVGAKTRIPGRSFGDLHGRLPSGNPAGVLANL